ncbi:MAG: putative transcriptional regulator, AsnC/Lrp family [Betaproteobacteria bacterium]|nr:putative transcriptional regulator, AsnC/Lrp family [Betaproteobacteria bacterium]
MSFDKIDLQILALLQQDASLSVSIIAEKVRLSVTPCWRRIQRLEGEGVIRKRVALLDAAKLNVGVTVFVMVKTSRHNQEWFEKFHAAVMKLPEVVEFYRMSGDMDYLLRVVVSDIAGYDAVYKKLIRTADLFDVSSSFAMEQIKYTTALPLTSA